VTESSRASVPEVAPRPAATVALLRPGPRGLEVLLTRRPATMAFAASMFVFPGGAVDPGDGDPGVVARSRLDGPTAAAALGDDLDPVAALAAHVAAIRELWEEAGILLAEARGGRVPGEADVAAARTALLAGETTFAAALDRLGVDLRTDDLVPLSRWVTPPGYPRRFDARFFAAELPPDALASFEGDEVTEHAWLTPADALRAMAERRVGMWLPTSTTLQQLEHAGSIAEIDERLAPRPIGAITVEDVAPSVVRVVMPAAGGVAGQSVNAYLVGSRELVVVDPGDPTGPALDRCVALAAERGAAIRAVVLTNVDPDHAAGAEALAERLGIPVLVGPGGGRSLPYATVELGDLVTIDAADVPLRAVSTPGPRPEHLAYVIGAGELVVTGDLDGVRGARMIPGPADEAAWSASRARLDSIAGPVGLRLPGHGPGRQLEPGERS
jgi:ribonuclease/clavin/mitogillin